MLVRREQGLGEGEGDGAAQPGKGEHRDGAVRELAPLAAEPVGDEAQRQHDDDAREKDDDHIWCRMRMSK